MDSLTHFMPFNVTSDKTDMFARLRPGALLNLLIESAIQSADSLGFGYSGLQKHQLFWVLSRISIEIYRPMQWYEAGTVETWPKDLEKILYLRDFIIRDHREEVVGRATSGWLAIDSVTKRPKKLSDIELSLFNRLKDKHAMDTLPEKLQHISEGETFNMQATYFDIDLNAHVTSSRYVDWMMDTFGPDFHNKNYPTSLTINFMRETKPGESIRLMRQVIDPKSYVFEGFNNSQEVPAFLGRLGY